MLSPIKLCINRPLCSWISRVSAFRSYTKNSITIIKDMDAFKKTVLDEQSDSKLKLVDFYATWCSPCKAMDPILTKWAVDYKDKVDFYKVDVDHSSDIAGYCDISAVPTILMIRGGKIVSRVRGANPKGVKDDLESLTKE